MGKFDNTLICTDLDGTLLRSDRTISRENLEAIEYFKEQGGYFTFITGRMPFFVDFIYESIRPNAPFGCINGGGIYDYPEKKYLWTRELPSSVLEVVEYIDDHLPEIGIQVNAFGKIYFCKENQTMVNFRKTTKVPYLPGYYDQIHEPIAKIVFGSGEEEVIQALIKLLQSHPRYSEFDYIRSEHALYEILPKGSGKGAVLPQLARILQVPMEKTIAVGDYNNDISMLQSAGLGIAVANATPETKAAADLITVSNNQHAIAKIISDLDKGILFP